MSEKKPRRCFVIGPIGKPGSPERKHADMLLNAVIRQALEGTDPPYEIVRSDKVAEPGMINDRVIHDILNADLVVADLTFLNANAFYELGIRHAAEKPVINFAQIGTELPFDTYGYRAIMEDITSWEGMESARRQIREQAKATEADGYQVSNPITQANASFKMRESADPMEQIVADLQIRLERLEARGETSTIAPPEDGRLNVLTFLLPLLTSDEERTLVAGYAAQVQSPDHSFNYIDVRDWLAGHGVNFNVNLSKWIEAHVVQGYFRRAGFSTDPAGTRRRPRYSITATGLARVTEMIKDQLAAGAS